ncbi:frequency clock protein-like protein [Plenodomus tracheiphilus IPT5]|uniref:Frequency clock protein-like protein n=1 Tax=Plenodomus tracheiphilus IPT5 TaxID=1408161 RepID=A0A6A7APQ5_9PLEO|nr:frequency clock protein-like protein [Plenodomus tracheiphilus IPT5]
MNDPPRPAPMSAHQHPRRPPAHQSVSLRHSPPAPRTRSKPRNPRKPPTASSPNTASDKANPPSSVSPKLLSNALSSGESSDAAAWFESTNKHALQSTASFNEIADDPPFFLRNASSSETPPEGSHILGQSGVPYRPHLALAATDGSSTEDFRSVIDDLTVVNKKLKQKLKKYERMYDAHLQEEKLFEVRFHGLPDHKKKELEETLRKFASELDDGVSTDYPQIQSHAPTLQVHNTVSSTSRFAESGYASLSASGQNSSAHSNLQEKDRRKLSKSAYNRQQQSIQSYLHDIPSGLLPNNNAPMTDKSRKKLVVRRLEQIFAGKMSVPGNHPQPMQQEEVAQSAATADREQREATGQLFKPEGTREARIRSEKGTQESDALDQTESTQAFLPVFQFGEQDFVGSGLSPDQRPTRPLDLDLHRAQVPTENMDYIRHLGFTPPDMDTGDEQLTGHGWIYLNLLINMAQLHTLNVTPDFVKDALHEYSAHLEMSRDGRKIRWKGGQDVTVHSGGSSSDYYSGASPDEQSVARSSAKSNKTAVSGDSSESTADPEQKARRLLRLKREDEQNKFAYKPMFFHKEESDDEDDFDVESTSGSMPQPQPAGNSSGFGSSAVQGSPSKPKPRRDDGPMIFYTRAKFCTDLSGDRLGATLTNPGAYKAMTSHPLGAASASLPAYATSEIGEPRGVMDTSPMDVASGSVAATSSGDDIGFSPESLIHDSGNNTPDLVEFEASGLGGVQPEDNFSVHVRRSQISTALTRHPGRRRSSLYPQKIKDVLSAPKSKSLKLETTSPRASPQRVIKEQILSASRKSLPNSALPPASFLPFDSTSSGDLSDVSDNESSESDSDSEEGPATAFQILNISPMGKGNYDDDDSEEASEYSEDSDDGSVDLLATARQLDPTTIRASEREYDAALAERLAEVIPAGSSAATAGGGSGFNTPAHKHAAAALSREGSMHKAKQSPASGSVSSRSRNLKRSRTSESANTVLNSGSKAQKSQKTAQ